MAESENSKIPRERQEPIRPMFLAPFTHRLNPEGTACDESCPACIWSEQSRTFLQKTAPR
jgi:hypothetical protein